MEENQKKLYDHFIDLSVNGKDEIQRNHGLEYAKEILKNFPQFAKKKEDKEKPAEEEKAPGEAPERESDKGKKTETNSKGEK